MSVLGTVLAFLLLGSPLFANGVQENRVAKAKELIAAKNYNDAILLLTTVVREEPDRQDEAQELISQIVKLRNQYNADYESVIKLLYDQKDEATALQVISQLEALDTNPNKQTQDEIAQAKRTARLIANNKRYNDIMARALAQLNQRNYGAAVQVYLEGQDLAKDMFTEGGYGTLVSNQVDRAWEDLKAASALFVAAEAKLKALPDQGAALLGAEATSPALDAALTAVQDLASWRQRAWTDGRTFRTQNDFLVRNGRQEDFYLGYSYLFLHGPADSKTSEGILGAVDRLWNEILTPWTAAVRTGVEARYTAAKAALDAGRYTEAGAAFEGLRLRARQGLDVVTLWNRLSGIDDSGALEAEQKTRLAPVLPVAVWLEHRLTLAVQGLQTVKDVPRAAALVGASGQDRTTLEAARADTLAQKSAFASFQAVSTSWTTQAQALTAAGWSVIDPAAFATGWQATWAGYKTRAQAQEAEFVDRRGTLDYGLLDNRFTALQSSLASARALAEGTKKYPLQASDQLKALRPLQDTLAKDIGTFVTLYNGEPADVKTAAVLRWPVRGNELLARLTTAQAQQSQLLTASLANYAQSQTLKKQGQDLVPQIDTAVSLNTADGFTKARTVLGQISARYGDSLALQDDDGFAATANKQVLDLGDRITAAENKWLIAEVQKLIDQGSTSYTNSQFVQAKATLTKAKALWDSYHPTDPNPEVQYWLDLANIATSVASGRVLTPLDPLYNEVRQLLNSAQRDFSLGKDELAAGNRDQGLILMAQAKSTLGKVLLPFPFNQEARLLNLQILQASDPDNFPALFKQNFDDAKARSKVRSTAIEALNDLRDLEGIQPNFPGLQAALADVKLLLTPPVRVVDTTTATRVKDLVNRASRLYNNGNATTDQLNSALDLVKQAQALDVTNRDASNLYFAIYNSLPPPALNQTQTAELTAIQRLVQTNDYQTARTQLDAFLKANPGTEKIPRVIQLGRQIDANL